MDTLGDWLGTLIIIAAIAGAGGLSIAFILARAGARAEGEATIEGRLAQYAGSNRECV